MNYTNNIPRGKGSDQLKMSWILERLFSLILVFLFLNNKRNDGKQKKAAQSIYSIKEVTEKSCEIVYTLHNIFEGHSEYLIMQLGK